MFKRKTLVIRTHELITRTDRTHVIPSVAHVVHHHTILVKVAFRLSYWLKLHMGQIWLVYARYTVGPLSKSVDSGRINASVVAPA